MPNGTIARLLIDKGFGFIRDESGVEHFFHRSSVRQTVTWFSYRQATNRRSGDWTAPWYGLPRSRTSDTASPVRASRVTNAGPYSDRASPRRR